MSKALQDTDLATVYETEEGKFYLDQLNLLYVAFTRPEVALFMCGKVTSQSSPSKEWLHPYFEQTELGNYTENKFTYGAFNPITRTDEADKTTTNPTYAIRFYGKKMEKPVLSYKSAENWALDELDEKRQFGTKVHWILSQITCKDQLEYALERATVKGKITEAEADKIESHINLLFADPRFSDYFKHPNQLNEKELINAKGRKLIPDKIITSPTDTLVVDFKTGQPTPLHAKQVSEYMQVLADIGFKGLRGEIYYTETQHVQPVMI